MSVDTRSEPHDAPRPAAAPRPVRPAAAVTDEPHPSARPGSNGPSRPAGHASSDRDESGHAAPDPARPATRRPATRRPAAVRSATDPTRPRVNRVRAGGLALVALVILGVLVSAARVPGLSARVDRLESDLDSALTRLDTAERTIRDGAAATDKRLAGLKTTTDQVASALKGTQDGVAAVTKAQDAQSKRTVDVGNVADRALPSVVLVRCAGTIGTGFALQGLPVASGAKSAVLTNEHVVSGCPDGKVQVSTGGSTVPARVSAVDVGNDLAVLQVNRSIPALAWAPAGRVGDPVVVIGNPEGLVGTVTSGIISRVDQGAYQYDAAANPGNSGGPVLDRSGQVLGVHSASVVGDQAEGLNLAVPLRAVCVMLVSRCPTPTG